MNDDTTMIDCRHARRARRFSAQPTRARAGARSGALAGASSGAPAGAWSRTPAGTRVAAGVAILAASLISPAVLGQSHAGHGAHEQPPAASAGAAPTVPAATAGEAATDGEIRRVDGAGGRLTLRHGPIPSLDMPAMTMVFRVVAPASIDGLAPGDRVRFRAALVDGDPAVVWIEKAR